MSKNKFEVNMSITEITNVTTRIGWFHSLYIQSQSGSDSNLPSRLKINSLLDSDASILVLNIQTCMLITQLFIVCTHDQHDTSQTLTIVKQSEVPIKQHISVTCFSSIETKSRCFMIPFRCSSY